MIISFIRKFVLIRIPLKDFQSTEHRSDVNVVSSLMMSFVVMVVMAMEESVRMLLLLYVFVVGFIVAFRRRGADENGTPGVVDDIIADRTHDCPSQNARSTGAYHQNTGLNFVGDVDDRFSRFGVVDEPSLAVNLK